jgi:hypothetical protein
MPELSPLLSLPYLLPSQAQKHVTHNEALEILDASTQIAVAGRTANAPPPGPVEGDRHLVGSAPTGAWAGQAGRLAVLTNGGWRFVAPQAGWLIWVEDEATLWLHDGATLILPLAGTLADGDVTLLGVNAAADATNRLTVRAPATLFNAEGGSHNLKINKDAATDTASLLFQTGFSGRAEIGTTGSDALAVKVSANGTAWTTALSVNATTGLVSGQAVTQSATDSTAGRLIKTGDYGLGGVAPLILNAGVTDNSISPGLYAYSTSSGSSGGPSGSTIGTLLHVRRAAGGGESQLFFVEAATGGGITVGETWSRVRTTGAWTNWNRQFGQRNILGTVSQASGVPTGALIERGSNANGEFVRFADGLQVCTRVNLTTPNASTALGSLFRSADVAWTYPAAFAVAPVVTGNVDDIDVMLSAGVPSTTAVTLRAIAAVTKAAAQTLRVVAVGRWF